MRGWLTACALWVPMLAVVAARADSPELRACANDAALPQLRVEACTALMHAGAAVGVDAAWLLLQRGEAYADLGELDFALAHFDAARRLRPGDPKILERHAAASMAAGWPWRAIEDYDAALEQAPGDADLLRDRGIAHLASHEYAAVIADFDAALRQRPDDPDILMRRGWARVAADDFERAAVDFEAAIHGLSDFPQALAGRAAVQAARRAPDLAFADLDAALRLDPTLAEALSMRGMLHLTLRQDEAAVADLEAVLRLQPGNRQALNGLSVIHESRGDRAGAQALREAAWGPRVRSVAIGCWNDVRRGKAEDAEFLCESAATMWAEHATLEDSLGFVYLQEGKPKDALFAFGLALKERPTLSTALLGRSIAERLLGDVGAAERDAAAARALAPGIEDSLRDQGILPRSGYDLTRRRPAPAFGPGAPS